MDANAFKNIWIEGEMCLWHSIWKHWHWLIFDGEALTFIFWTNNSTGQRQTASGSNHQMHFRGANGVNALDNLTQVSHEYSS